MENKENLKTLEEPSALKEEAKGVNKKKLKYLTEEELALVSGGNGTGLNGCTGGVVDPVKCYPCFCYDEWRNRCNISSISPTQTQGCTGGMPDWKCSGCPNLQHIGNNKDRCTLSGQETGA